MAKGRKLSKNRNYEWFLGSYGNNGHAQASNCRDDSSELREEDVWSMIHNGEPDNNYGNITVVRTRRRDERRVGGESRISFQDSGSTTAAASAPVSVPDWSKILRAESVEFLPEMDDNNNDEAEMVPPHEYLAREYARSRNAAAATSVFEGVGRTLKGRDMRRVRDAVWSQTGFDG